jgi:pilus assembly protein CpaF
MATPANAVWNLLAEIGKKANVTELIINGPQSVFVEHQGELVQLNVQLTPADLDTFTTEVAAQNRKTFDATHPLFDGTLTDGSRINMVARDYVEHGPAITIRRHPKTIRTFDGLPNVFGLDARWVKLLKKMVAARVNIIVAGGTGSGKTTFLNLLLQELTPQERVVTIEDTRELHFQLPNVVRMETRGLSTTVGGVITTRDMVRNALRMRPDRVIIGEVRGGEVFDLLQAMNTGHDGSMASVHASSAGETLSRVENLFLLAGHDVPVRAIRQQIASAVNFVVHVKRNREGQRVVAQVSEIAGMEGERILMQDIGMLKDGKLAFTGMVPKVVAKLVEAGLPADFFSH